MLPKVITDSALYSRTLSPRPEDPSETQRERLRACLVSLRERCGYLAGEIRRDLPDLTVHDLTHLDALWEVSSTIAGDKFVLTPAEGFVLGGAFLFHDLAMAVAATSGGYEGLTADPRWADLVAIEYQNVYGQSAAPADIRAPEPRIRKKALFNLLRQTHAERAERLAFIAYKATDGADLFLIEDTEIRQTFGRAIGQIAHSHWWGMSEVERRFTRIIGAPHWAPTDWIVDPMKLACLLRAADAAHLDARRAPTFLKALSHVDDDSEVYWRFQERLNKPYLDGDALVFTTGQAFPLADVGAWWVCYEHLRVVDRELRAVDSLFADRGQPRLAARRVAGVDTPDRLATYIQTDGWLPINAQVHVTDLPRVIRSIGGEELYGRRPAVALRELLQNGADAVRARRLYENRDPGFGRVDVALRKDADGHSWLEVSDLGVGMSRRVLADFLLDFGSSFWTSAMVQEEFPGLLSGGLQATGKYGIGFFSAFMIADRVQVVTRRCDAAAVDTLVLEFSSGLSGRPIVRPAERSEQLIDGGTRVRLLLREDPRGLRGLLARVHDDGAYTISELCGRLAPALDVDVYVSDNGAVAKVVGAGDWASIRGEALLARMDLDSEDVASEDEKSALLERAGRNLRYLRDENGLIIGRACITVGFGGRLSRRVDVGGAVVVGGLRACALTGIAGILQGEPLRASRDAAKPIVGNGELKRWAEEQASLVPNLWTEADHQAACAQYIRLCGGATGNLPIAEFRGRWVSAVDIRELVSPLEEVLLCSRFDVGDTERLLSSFEPSDKLIVVESDGIPGLLQGGSRSEWPRGLHTGFAFGSGSLSTTLGGAVVEAVADAWGVDRGALSGLAAKEIDVELGRDGARVITGRARRLRRPRAPEPAGK